MIPEKVLDEGSASNFYAYFKEREDMSCVQIRFIDFIRLHFLAGLPIEEPLKAMSHLGTYEKFPLLRSEDVLHELIVKVRVKIDRRLVPDNWQERFSQELRLCCVEMTQKWAKEEMHGDNVTAIHLYTDFKGK